MSNMIVEQFCVEATFLCRFYIKKTFKWIYKVTIYHVRVFSKLSVRASQRYIIPVCHCPKDLNRNILLSSMS